MFSICVPDAADDDAPMFPPVLPARFAVERVKSVNFNFTETLVTVRAASSWARSAVVF
jgi:hypothetical protein